MTDMGFGAGSSLATIISRLVQSPRMRTLGSQFKSTLPQMGGPFQYPTNNSSASRSRGIPGASPNLGGVLNDLGSRFKGTGYQLGNVVSRLGASQQQNDPLMDLYQQLVAQLQEPVNMPTGIDSDNLMEQVKKAINPIYDQRAQAAEDRTGRATSQVKDMYRALANDYERLAPAQAAQVDAAKQEIEQLYGQLRSNIEGSYSRISEEQSDLFKQLGIEDALPAVLEDQSEIALEAANAASENQAQQEQRYMDIGNVDETYYREGSPLATMTGNEISTDMLAQLSEYLNQVEAERSSGIQSTYMDQLSQAQNALAQQQQSAQGEAGRRQEMLWQILQSQLNGKQQEQVEQTPDTFMSQLPPQVQSSVGNAFTRLQRSPESIYGKVQDPRNPVPGTFVDTNPNWYLAQADEMLRRGEIDATTHQALQMYMQLYFQMGQ